MAEAETRASGDSAEISANDQGVPVIAGADSKGRQIAMDYQAGLRVRINPDQKSR